MKKSIFFVALAAMLFLGNNVNAQFRMNIGYTTNSFLADNNTIDGLPTTRGFFFGMAYNYAFWGELGIQVGLQGRYHWNNSDTQTGGKAKDQTVALDLPVLLNYRFEIADKFYITPMVGANISYALLGKTTTDPNTGTTEWYKDGAGNLDFKPFTVGLLMGLDISYCCMHLYWHINVIPSEIGKIAGEKVTGGQNFIGLGFDF